MDVQTVTRTISGPVETVTITFSRLDGPVVIATIVHGGGSANFFYLKVQFLHTGCTEHFWFNFTENTVLHSTFSKSALNEFENILMNEILTLMFTMFTQTTTVPPIRLSAQTPVSV